jgi:hypothetical protein
VNGTILNVAPVSTKIPVVSQLVSKKNEGCICWEMHGCGSGVCWVGSKKLKHCQTFTGSAALQFSDHKGKCTCGLVAVEVLVFAHAIARVVKREEIRIVK